MNEQLDRIRTMEQALNRSARAVAELAAALETYEAVLPQLQALKSYYESPQWQADYNDDCAGKIPKDLPRGVLTQDALYDLLGDNDRLMGDLIRLCEQLKGRMRS